MNMPDDNMFVGNLRMMNCVLYVKRSGTADANAHPNDCDSQGKNARQSHPGRISLNSGLRAMRLLEQRTSF